MAKQAEDKTRPKGKPQEEFEGKRKPCRFFLADSGCRRGRGCPSGHQLDGEKKCWTCGGRDHMATTCPTTEESESKPRQHRRVQRPLKAMPPTSPKILHSGGVFTFFGVLGGKKNGGKIARPILGTFWRMFAVFWCLRRTKAL